MDALSEFGAWITDNESLLSGMAALIVLAGVVLSPLGIGVRRFLGGGRELDPDSPESNTSGAGASSPVQRAKRMTFQELVAPSSHEIFFAESDGVRIAYSVRGSGPPHMVLTPGIVSHLNVGDHLPPMRNSLDALAAFARVVHFDKRGQGLSDPTLHAPSLEERSRDIEAVMRASGTERAVLVGVSEGGPMCVHFAYTHPECVQALILFGTTASWVQREDFPIGIPRRHIEGLARRWGTGKGREIFFPGLSVEQLDEETYAQVERTIATRETVRGLAEMMLETDVRPLLSDIGVPTLVLHYAGDLAVPIRLGRALAEGLPNAEFMEIDAVDHGDLSSSPEAIERIREFCTEHTRAEA